MVSLLDGSNVFSLVINFGNLALFSHESLKPNMERHNSNILYVQGVLPHFYLVSYYTNWVKTSGSYSSHSGLLELRKFLFMVLTYVFCLSSICLKCRLFIIKNLILCIASKICPRSSDPFYIVTYYI